MIAATGTNKLTGGRALFLGLSHANLELLRQRKPIRLTSSSHPGVISPGHEVVILSEATEADIVATLEKAGMLRTAEIIDQTNGEPDHDK
jgi:hypothetical protein